MKTMASRHHQAHGLFVDRYKMASTYQFVLPRGKKAAGRYHHQLVFLCLAMGLRGHDGHDVHDVDPAWWPGSHALCCNTLFF